MLPNRKALSVSALQLPPTSRSWDHAEVEEAVLAADPPVRRGSEADHCTTGGHQRHHDRHVRRTRCCGRHSRHRNPHKEMCGQLQSCVSRTSWENLHKNILIRNKTIGRFFIHHDLKFALRRCTVHTLENLVLCCVKGNSKKYILHKYDKRA